MKNRIEQYLPKDAENVEQNGVHIKFKKFDPTVTQEIVRKVVSNKDKDISYDDDDTDEQVQRLSMVEENQIVQDMDLWVAHLNINITPPLFFAIEQLDGVEAIKKMTRYKFKFGVGHLFNADRVKQQISDLVLRQSAIQKSK